MIDRAHIFAAIAAVIVVASLGMKLARYFPDNAHTTVSELDTLDEAFARSGWSRLEDSADERVSAIKVHKYAHNGCHSTLSVAILGTTSGLEMLVRERLGDNIAFYQDGTEVEQLNRFKNHIVASKRGVSLFFGAKLERQLPTFALSPKPETLTSGCTRPKFAHNDVSVN